MVAARQNVDTSGDVADAWVKARVGGARICPDQDALRRKVDVNDSYPYDPDRHEPGSLAAEGRCSHHGRGSSERGSCTGEPVVSFKDRDGGWQSGCSLALEQLVERGEIAPLGQGA